MAPARSRCGAGAPSRTQRDCTVNILDQVFVSRRFGAAIPPLACTRGSAIAIDPTTGRGWVVWREFGTSVPHAISVADSTLEPLVCVKG